MTIETQDTAYFEQLIRDHLGSVGGGLIFNSNETMGSDANESGAESSDRETGFGGDENDFGNVKI
jgi:hypothetical protein